jgi:hypothetical protein
MESTAYSAMSAGDMLHAVGDDAAKWAAAFAEQHPQIDKDVMIGWFANAIENTWDIRCSRLRESDAAWADFQADMERRKAFFRELAA